MKKDLKIATIEVVESKVFTGILGLIGVISALSFGSILLFIPAASAGMLGRAMFSLSLGLLLVSVGTFFGLYIRRSHLTVENRSTIHGIALREAVLLSVLVLVYLWLARYGALNVWIAALTLLAIMGLEYFFLTHAHS